MASSLHSCWPADISIRDTPKALPLHLSTCQPDQRMLPEAPCLAEVPCQPLQQAVLHLVQPAQHPLRSRQQASNTQHTATCKSTALNVHHRPLAAAFCTRLCTWLAGLFNWLLGTLKPCAVHFLPLQQDGALLQAHLAPHWQSAPHWQEPPVEAAQDLQHAFLQGQLSSQVQPPAHSHFSPQGIFAVG